MATKITTGLIDSGAITSALITDGSITATDLHTTLDLTGKTVTVATATAGDNDTSVASTAFVATAIANLADSAPETLNTLNELAAALGDDANFSTTVTNSIALKAPLASPTFTGTVTADSLTVDGGSGNSLVNLTPSGTFSTVVSFANAASAFDIVSYGSGSASADNFRIRDNGVSRLNIAGNGDISFYEDTGTTPKLFWDASAECLSIGVIGTETDRRFQISDTSPSTATTQYGIVANPTMSNDVTGSVYNIYSQANVASGTTLTNLYNLYLGATGLSGSTITNNYGLYQAGASEKNYFAGNVGIGTTSPLAKNQITGSGTSGQVTASWILQNTSSGTAGMDITGAAGASRLRFVYGGGPGTGTNSLTEAMCIGTEGTYAGNVGIGTASPAAKLQVGWGSDQLQFTNPTAGKKRIGATYTGYVSDNIHASMDLQSAGSSGGDISFNTTPSGGSLTERLRIDESGNVGIGTSSPLTKTTIATTSGNTALTFQQTNNSTTNWLIGAQYNASNTFEITPSTAAGGSTFSNPALAINSSGDVSIGATKKLYLDGGGDTYINEYSANEIGFWTGGVRRVSISAGNLYMTGSGGIFAGGTSGGGYNLGTTTIYGSYGCGPQNSSYMHHTTDRPTYYWDKPCTASGGFSTYSDERLKENITTIDSALDKVALMNGVTFNWIDSDTRGGGNTGKQFGVLAQNMLEVDSALPTLNVDPLEVQDNIDDSEQDTDYYSMDYSRLTPFFIEAIKELKTKLEAAEARIATLEG